MQTTAPEFRAGHGLSSDRVKLAARLLGDLDGSGGGALGVLARGEPEGYTEQSDGEAIQGEDSIMPEPLKEPGADRDAVALREEWLERLDQLVADVKGWVEAAGWRTREITKRMKDSVLGTYRAPALLMQRETVEVILDPVARFVVGADGAVELYLMPAYDDIAGLYFIDGEWRIYFVFREPSAVAGPVEPDDLPFSKESLVRVLDAIAAHAA